MRDLAKRLYPIGRSLTGDGVRRTLALLQERVPLEIREVLLHALVYCGVPLGVDAIRNAAEVLAGMGIDLDGDLRDLPGSGTAGAR